MKRFSETDVVDDQGNVLVSPGLKVRHKDSQFEYTIEDVVQDENGEIQVILQLPEEPRFDPEDPEGDVLTAHGGASGNVGRLKMIVSDNATEADKIMHEYEVSSELYFEPEDEETTDLLVVPQEEFERDYEVK
jgi:rRNA maturation protein Nop10